MQPAVFVDCYQTLSGDLYWTTLEDSKRRAIENYVFDQKREELANPWMRGGLTYQEIHHVRARRCDTGYHYQSLLQKFKEGCQAVSVDDDTAAALSH